MRRVLILLALVCLPFMTRGAGAHESRPLYVEIVERAPGAFAVAWKIPPSAIDITSPSVAMPKSCEAATPETGSRLVKRRLFQCSGDLSGEEIRIVFPGFNPSISTMFRMKRLSGVTHTRIQSPDEPAWTVPDDESTTAVAGGYFLLGVQHILEGYDHLLFVACLVFIAGGWRRILVTITGFTVAHSVTLALAALGLLRLPTPPVEAVIALSILFLAVEITRGRRNSLIWRFPVLVSCSFGLLHGFGFASVLSEIGLPQTEVPAALLFFNLGVEAGQIGFVVLLSLGARLLSASGLARRAEAGRNQDLLPPHLATPAAYAIGILASFWTVERVTGFWS